MLFQNSIWLKINHKSILKLILQFYKLMIFVKTKLKKLNLFRWFYFDMFIIYTFKSNNHQKEILSVVIFFKLHFIYFYL